MSGVELYGGSGHQHVPGAAPPNGREAEAGDVDKAERRDDERGLQTDAIGKPALDFGDDGAPEDGGDQAGSSPCW